jgi:chromosome segregation ATPase
MRYEQITGPGWNGEPLYVRVETPSDEIPPTEPNTSAMIELIEHLKDKVDALSFELAESTYRLEALHWQKNNLSKKVDELHEMIDHKQAHIDNLKKDIKPWLGADLELKGYQVEELKHEMKMDKMAHREEVLGLKETIMELREKCHHLENELDALEDIS